jgi:transcriptional regulator with XRE-family HTH domain
LNDDGDAGLMEHTPRLVHGGMPQPAAHQPRRALLRQRREAKGWAQTDLATRACLSLRQVRQIEDGGNSSFYSESVKATAARKIATLLGLSSESAFVQAQAATDAVHPAADGLTPSDTEHAPAPVLAPVVHAPGPATGADLSSVMTHVAVATADIDPPPPQSLSSDGAQGESRSSSFLWIALLAVAVGAGVSASLLWRWRWAQVRLRRCWTVGARRRRCWWPVREFDPSSARRRAPLFTQDCAIDRYLRVAC